MAEVTDQGKRAFLFFKLAQAARREKLLMQQMFLTHAVARRRRLAILSTCLVILLVLSAGFNNRGTPVLQATTKESTMVENRR